MSTSSRTSTPRAAGLRPCRRCHPDDFARGFDPVIEEIDALAAEVRIDPASFPNVRALVQRSGYGATRLFELFRLHFDTDAGRLPHRGQSRPREAPSRQTGRRPIAGRRLRLRLPYAVRLSRALQAPHRHTAPPTAVSRIKEHGHDPALRHLRHAPRWLHRRRRRRRAPSAAAFGGIDALHSTAKHETPPGLEGACRRPPPGRRVLRRYAPGLRPPARAQRHDVPARASGATSPPSHSAYHSYGAWRRISELPPCDRAGQRTNPICLILPCHRVIGTDGSLTGYAYGIEIKRALLEHERAVLARATAAA